MSDFMESTASADPDSLYGQTARMFLASDWETALNASPSV